MLRIAGIPLVKQGLRLHEPFQTSLISIRLPLHMKKRSRSLSSEGAAAVAEAAAPTPASVEVDMRLQSTTGGLGPEERDSEIEE
jgi:hypothetical protein